MSTVLATVGDVKITLADVRNHMIGRSGPERVDQVLLQPDVLHVALAALMDQFVWAAVAKMEGVELTPEEAGRVAALEAELLATRYVGDVVQGRARPTDERIREYYNENQSRYIRPVRIGARHVLVNSRPEADRIKKLAEGGEDFSDLARKHSLDANTRDLGGALGFVSGGKSIIGIGKNAAFEEAVLVLDQGEMTIVQTDKGWHVVKAEKREGGDLTPIDEVYEQIAEGLVSSSFVEVYQAELARARDLTDAKFDENALVLVTGTPQNTGRIMQAAKQAPDTRAKVEMYRRVAYDFADSKHAAEAQFRMAYALLVEAKDKRGAERELLRLQKRYPKSRYGPAGAYLLEHLDDDPELFGSAEDVLKAASQ
jgi:hypothetical protein